MGPADCVERLNNIKHIISHVRWIECNRQSVRLVNKVAAVRCIAEVVGENRMEEFNLLYSDWRLILKELVGVVALEHAGD